LITTGIEEGEVGGADVSVVEWVRGEARKSLADEESELGIAGDECGWAG